MRQMYVLTMLALKKRKEESTTLEELNVWKLLMMIKPPTSSKEKILTTGSTTMNGLRVNWKIEIDTITTEELNNQNRQEVASWIENELMSAA